jgi:hypothetical protein
MFSKDSKIYLLHCFHVLNLYHEDFTLTLCYACSITIEYDLNTVLLIFLFGSDRKNLTTLHTTSIIPVDLNVFLLQVIFLQHKTFHFEVIMKKIHGKKNRR